MKKTAKAVLEFGPVSFLVDVVKLYFVKYVSRSAAHLAYFLILTFFPILICIASFFSRLNLDFASMLDDALNLVPGSIASVFHDYLGYVGRNYSTAMLITGIFLTILFASAAIRGLTNFMHELYGRPATPGFNRFLGSILFALLLLVTVYLSLAVVITGRWFFRFLGQLTGLHNLAQQMDFWQWLKYIILIAIVFLFISLLYRFTGPSGKPAAPVIPGALLASLSLTVASLVFSFIVSRSTRYSLIYGSLASVIILLVWLYLCGNVLILGNVVNYVIYCRRQKKPCC